MKWCVNKYHETESQVWFPLLKLGTVWKLVENFMLHLRDMRRRGFQFRVQSFITSIYPLTGASQGCGDSHDVIRNISFEL